MDPWIIGAAAYVVIMMTGPVLHGSAAMRARKRLRRWRKQWRENIPQLERWAAAKSWTHNEGINPDWVEDAERAMYIVGAATPGVQIHFESSKFAIGSIVRGEVNGHRWMLFDRWYDSGLGSPLAVATMTTAATTARGHIHIDADGAVEVEGQLPTAPSAAAITAQLRDLGVPARIQMLEGEVIVQCPGLLTAERCDALFAMLAWLHRELPRRPGAGPMR